MIICGRRVEQITSAAKEINAAAKESGQGGEVIALEADVGTKAGVIDFYQQCEKHIDKVSFVQLNRLRLNGGREETCLS